MGDTEKGTRNYQGGSCMRTRDDQRRTAKRVEPRRRIQRGRYETRSRRDMIRITLAALSMAAASAFPVRAQIQPPYVDEGACPFECCTYGNWVARESTILYARPDTQALQVGMLEAGDTVLAETGHTASTPAPFVLRAAIRQQNREFAAGDTLWVLSYQGEGYFKVRYEDQVIADFELGFSPYGGSRGTRCENCTIGQLERELESVWWARIRLADGTFGWTNRPFDFDGNDACGDVVNVVGREEKVSRKERTRYAGVVRLPPELRLDVVAPVPPPGIGHLALPPVTR